MKHGLNGVSFPFGGISWDNKTTAKDRFRYFLLFLESKRILTNPIDMELKDECIESVLEIKRTLVDVTKDAEFTEKDTDIIRSLVAACNNYLDTVRSDSVPHLIYKDGYNWADAVFDAAMKKLRKTFKDGIEQIEDRYKLHYKGRISDKY